MAENDKNNTTTYGSSENNKTETYGNSENQKTTAYNSKQNETAAYTDLQIKEFKSRTHGIGVGDKLTLKSAEFTITGIISEGTGEAVIYKVENSSKQTFALKLYFEFRDSKEEPNFETLKRIKDIHDPDILKLHDFGVGTDKYQGRYCYEISDYAEGGDLVSVANFKTKYTKDFIEKSVVPEILNGIKKLHENKIYHGDLKPQNVFYIDKNQTDLVIGDYGSAKAYDLEALKDLHKTIVKGTNEYLAPEQARGIISEKNDYYSFGMILLHMLYPEQFIKENRFQQIDKNKFDKIVERQYNSQSVVDLNSSYKRLNNLIEGLTLINHINRFGKNEVEKWLNGEEVEVKYKASKTDSVQTVKLGYTTIKSEKDFIQVLESRSTWWEDLFEDVDTYFAIKAWLGSYRDIDSRKLFDEMINFYKPYGKDFVKEAAIRYFQPERDIQIDMNLFNFFTTDNIHEEVKKFVSKLDEIYKITSFEKVRFYLFQLELSLKQVSFAMNDKDLVLVNSIVEKICSTFGCIPENIDSRKTQIQDRFTAKYEKESYYKLIELFYSFFTERKYIDTKNRKFDDIKGIALTYANDETLFFDKFCEAELTVYLRKKQHINIQQNNYSGFLFSVFQDQIKSNLSIESIRFGEKNAVVYYKFKKSLTEFFSSKGIKKIVINEGDNKDIKLNTKLIPSGGALYSIFISAICKVHGVNEQSFELDSLAKTRSSIYNITKSYRKKKGKTANTFSAGLVVYSLPVLIAIIGAVVLVFTPKVILNYLYENISSDKDIGSLRTSVLIGYIYISIIISLIPAIIFYDSKSDNKNLHSNFEDSDYTKPLSLLGGIIKYSFITVIGTAVLGIVLFIVIGIARLFSGEYEIQPRVDAIIDFVFKISAFVIFYGTLIPLNLFYKRTLLEEKIIKFYVVKKVMILSTLIISCTFLAFSLIDLNLFGKNNQGKEIPALEIQRPLTKLYVVTTEVANVRSGPSTKAQIVGQVKRNDIVEVISKVEVNWYKIKFTTSDAYIHTSLIKENN